MGIVLRDGPLKGQPWPEKVTDDDARISRRNERGEHIVYTDTGERHPVTGERIFAYQPPRPTPIAESADDDREDDDDE